MSNDIGVFNVVYSLDILRRTSNKTPDEINSLVRTTDIVEHIIQNREYFNMVADEVLIDDICGRLNDQGHNIKVDKAKMVEYLTRNINR